MMDWKDILWELVQMIESAAPKAWEIALRQIYVNTIQNLMAVVAGVLGLISTWVIAIKVNGCSIREWDSEEWFLPITLSLICMLAIFGIGKALGMIINPEYYAIQTLINLTK